MKKALLSLLFVPAFISAEAIKLDIDFMFNDVTIKEECIVESGAIASYECGDVMLRVMPTAMEEMCCVMCQVIAGDREISCPVMNAQWGSQECVEINSDCEALSIRVIATQVDESEITRVIEALGE